MLGSILIAVAFPTLALAATYEVSVGDGGLVFNPPTTQAQVGDVVHFTFFPKAHSVTQSSFEAPCSPIYGGIDSGLQPTNGTEPTRPEFNITIYDHNPIYIYCKQPNGNHCGNGMVSIINPGEHSFEEFQTAAKNSGGVATNGSASASASASATSSYSTPPPQSWATATATMSHDSSTWTTVYTSYEGSPQPTYAAEPVTHTISVGQNGLTYGPTPNITAAIGDRVVFEFFPKNHTVTQSSFSAPCVPLEVSSGKPGFKSGFRPVAEGSTDKSTFEITVNDTAPIWYYCGQTNPTSHCGAGMVGSINAVESGPNNFKAFQDLAKRLNGTGSSSTGASGSGSGAAPTGSPNSASSLSSQAGLGLLVIAAGMGLAL